jgi:hypothetical protein
MGKRTRGASGELVAAIRRWLAEREEVAPVSAAEIERLYLKVQPGEVAAERERCAVIVEECAGAVNWGHSCAEFIEDALLEAAERIRRK